MIQDKTWSENNQKLGAVHYIPTFTLLVGEAACGLHGVCVFLS